MQPQGRTRRRWNWGAKTSWHDVACLRGLKQLGQEASRLGPGMETPPSANAWAPRRGWQWEGCTRRELRPAGRNPKKAGESCYQGNSLARLQVLSVQGEMRLDRGP